MNTLNDLYASLTTKQILFLIVSALVVIVIYDMLLSKISKKYGEKVFNRINRVAGLIIYIFIGFFVISRISVGDYTVLFEVLLLIVVLHLGKWIKQYDRWIDKIT